MSYLKILVHCVWTTRSRLPFLKDNIREAVISHILENSRTKDIYIDKLNGYNNHLHAIISLGGKQSISDVMQMIKGESSYWINKNKLTSNRFEWQNDFWAVSIGINHLKNLRRYIGNQVQHQLKKSVEDELDRLVREYGLERFED
jgi:REP element-mobilizing transposase RayT